MKKAIFIFIGLVVILLLIASFNSSISRIISASAKYGGIRDGDLIYKINFFGVLPIGKATFDAVSTKVLNAKDVYYLKAGTKNLDFYSFMFTGSARLESYIDKEKLNPISFKTNLILRGKEAVNKEVFYDQDNKTMTIGNEKREILSNTVDPLSAIFKMRNINFDKKGTFEMNLNTNQKNYILEGTAKVKELKIKGKNYKLIFTKSQIRRRDKNPYHKSNIDIVFLNLGESKNIPILIKVFASGLYITVDLIDIK